MPRQYGFFEYPDHLNLSTPDSAGGYIDNLYNDEGTLTGRGRFHPEPYSESEYRDEEEDGDWLEDASLGEALGAAALLLGGAFAISAVGDWWQRRRNQRELSRADPQPALTQRDAADSSTPAAQQLPGMTRDAWRDAVARMLILQTAPEDVWTTLSTAHIENPDDDVLRLQNEMRRLGPVDGLRYLSSPFHASLSETEPIERDQDSMSAARPPALAQGVPRLFAQPYADHSKKLAASLRSLAGGVRDGLRGTKQK